MSINLEDFQIKYKPKIQNQESSKNSKGYKPRKEPFIKGPIPLMWLVCALSLPGKTINVGLALWYWSGILKNRTFKFTNHMCQAFGIIRDRNKQVIRFGIPRQNKLRSLRRYEKAGLITVKWHKHKAPEVTILDV